MSKTQSKTQSKELSADQIALLNQSYPVSDGSNRVSLPRFGMLAKDIVNESGTGKNKKIEVVQAAGTFFTEKDEGELDEDGKKVWTKKYLGEEVEVIVVFHRKQLRLFDKGLNKFISSPIYDSKDQVIPLFLDKRRIAMGTQEELMALYPRVTEAGKKASKLKKETILYVLYEGELHQMNLSESNGYSFRDYSKKLNPSTVVTELSSVEETNGSNTYRKLVFKSKGMITTEDFPLVIENQDELKSRVESDAAYLLSQANATGGTAADAEYDALPASKE